MRIYRKIISPLLGDNCIYIPSCSEYFSDSVMRHGIIKGTILGITRLLRCSRHYLGGYDPVPEIFSFHYIKKMFIVFRRTKNSEKNL